MWLNDIKPKGGMLDGLRAGRRKLDGSDKLFPQQTKIEDALHNVRGVFYSFFTKIYSMYSQTFKCMVQYINTKEEKTV